MTARLWDIGRDLHSRVKSFFDNPPGPASTPLELLQAALDGLERKVQPSGRGSRIFPYDRIVVHIRQAEADRAAIEAVFRPLASRLRERLAELRCEAPAALETEVVFAAERVDEGPALTIECFHDGAPAVQEPPPAVEVPIPALRVAVVKGRCEQPEYAFNEPVIAIGRTADPVDALGNVRRNHVAFDDTKDGITETVARAHAQLRFDSGTASFHLFNEASSNPTFVLRGGRSLRVPPRDPRGLRLQSGDEVQLGRAVIRLTIG